MPECLSEEQLLAFADAQNSSEQHQSLRQHLRQCDPCSELVVLTLKALGSTTLGEGSLSESVTVDDALAYGDTIGRFIVREVVGRGAMGTIFSAYDPKLHRHVAIKRLHRGAKENAEHDGRLLEEARTLARLQHANVVSLYEVGTDDSGVFLAMELVDGVSVAAWQGNRQRTAKEVLLVYLQAGQGLLAAHAQGIVHRDFKPDNVLVTANDEVRVADFGLACTDHVDHEAIAGTLAYMAPEQLQGGVQLSARADQYSFCVSLYEGLTGALPPQTALRFACGHEPWPPLAKPKKISQRLWNSIAKGLSPKPEQRHSSLTTLLAEIQRELAPSRTIRSVALGASVAGIAIALFFSLGPQSSSLCDAGPERLAKVWNHGVRTRIESSFAMLSTTSFGRDTGTKVVQTLSRYGENWLDGHKRSCEATHRFGEQSEAILDLRFRCLNRRRDEFSALTEVLQDATLETLENGPLAALSLVPVSACENIDSLRAAVPWPTNVQEQHAIRKVQRQLNRVVASAQAGAVDGMQYAKLLRESLSEVTYPPLISDLHFHLAKLSIRHKTGEELVPRLQKAALAAATANDNDRLLTIWLLFVQHLGREASYVDAAEYLERAQLVGASLGDDDNIRARLLVARGVLARQKGDFQESANDLRAALVLYKKDKGDDDITWTYAARPLAMALDELGLTQDAERMLRSVVALEESAFGSEHPMVAATWRELGALHRRAGNFESAQQAYDRGHAIISGAYPPEHRAVARSLLGLANLEGDRGNVSKSIILTKEVLSLYRKIYASPHVEIADLLNNLGGLLAKTDALDSSVTLLSEALTMKQEVYPSDHPSIASTLTNLGSVYTQQGELDKADNVLTPAIEIFTKAYGATHFRTAAAMHNLADLAAQRGQWKRSYLLFSRVLEIWKVSLPKHSYLAFAYLGAAESINALGRSGEARSLAEQGLAILETNGADESQVATAQFALAKLLWPGHRKRARELATLAERGFGDGAKSRAVVQWLATHGR